MYVYGVNSGEAVYSRPIHGSKGWRHISSVPMKHVTASASDDIFATSRTGDVYRCSKSPYCDKLLAKACTIRHVNLAACTFSLSTIDFRWS